MQKTPKNPHIPTWWYGKQPPPDASKEEVRKVVNYVTNVLREIAFCTRRNQPVTKNPRSLTWLIKWETLVRQATDHANSPPAWELTGETEADYRARQACGSCYKGVWGGVPSVDQYRAMKAGVDVPFTAYDTRGD